MWVCVNPPKVRSCYSFSISRSSPWILLNSTYKMVLWLNTFVFINQNRRYKNTKCNKFLEIKKKIKTITDNRISNHFLKKLEKTYS